MEESNWFILFCARGLDIIINEWLLIHNLQSANMLEKYRAP